MEKEDAGQRQHKDLPLLVDPVPELPQDPTSISELPIEKQSHLVFEYLRNKKPLPSPRRARWIVFALYLTMTLTGWETGSSAPLLPFLQQYYKISYLVMSMIYVTSFIGGLISAALNVYLTDRLGFGLVCALGTLAFTFGYIIMATGGPYPLFAISFVLIGLGFGFQEAQLNTLTARLPNPNAKMALLHSFFGLGGTIAPFVSTPFVQHFPHRPYLLYALNLGVAVITLAITLIVFRGQTEEQLTGRVDGVEREPMNDQPIALADVANNPCAAHGSPAMNEASEGPDVLLSSAKKLKIILSMPSVYVFSFYSFLYVGLETTTAAWAPTYLIEARGANANAGYVTSGFWGGLTIGRVILIPVTKRLGNRWSVIVYSCAALGLQLVVWLVDDFITSAVCICLVGFFLAPIYPAAIVLITELIPDELHVGVIGMFGTIGGAGAAATPFILGAVADKYGFWVFGPYIMSIIATSILLWLLAPRHRQALRL